MMACMAVVAVCLPGPVASAEETAIPEAATPDCRPHAVRADDEGALLTREEKIVLMEQAFYDSLTRFEQCQRATSGAAAGNAGGGAGGNAVSGGAAGNGASHAGERGADGAERGVDGEKAAAAIESVAASDVQGTHAPVSAASPPDAMTSDTATSPGGLPENAPKDILALRRDGQLNPDNDSRLEAQIRRAATDEIDPEKQARLWNEYRRYKGLPLKPFVRQQGGSDAQEDAD